MGSGSAMRPSAATGTSSGPDDGRAASTPVTVESSPRSSHSLPRPFGRKRSVMEFTHILGWAVFGLVAGAIARFLHPGRDPMNWLWTMVLGILGAVVGGWVGTQVFGANANN